MGKHRIQNNEEMHKLGKCMDMAFETSPNNNLGFAATISWKDMFKQKNGPACDISQAWNLERTQVSMILLKFEDV